MKFRGEKQFRWEERMGLVGSILLAGGGGTGGAFHYLWDSRVIFPGRRATDRGSYSLVITSRARGSQNAKLQQSRKVATEKVRAHKTFHVRQGRVELILPALVVR